MKHLSRRDFLVTTAKTGVLVATMAGAGALLTSLSGCGSGDNKEVDNQTVRTIGNGLLSTMSLTPMPGATFISRAEDFELSWPDGNPPAEFTVTLHRFLEPRGGEGRETPTQRIEVAEVGSSRWRVRRTDDFELDARGVYYLQLTAPGQSTERYAFVVDSRRAETVNPGTGGFVEDIIISPRPGSAFLARGQSFRLRWTEAEPPPSTFAVSLRRYKEPRGDDTGDDEEQRSGPREGSASGT